MDQFIGMLGVILGWMLSEVSSAFNRSRESNELIASALDPLFYIFGEKCHMQERVRIFLDGIEQLAKTIPEEPTSEDLRPFVAALRELEEIRKESASIPDEEMEQLRARLDHAVTNLARIDPIAAYTARGQLDDFNKYRELDLDVVLKENPEAYPDLLELTMDAFDDYLKDLVQLIRNLAWQHSISMWMRVRRHLRDEKEIVGEAEQELHRRMRNFFVSFSASEV